MRLFSYYNYLENIMNTGNNFPQKPQPAPKPGTVKVVRAMYNYTARRADELSFQEGDVLYVFDRSNPHWWKATCGSKKGLIPRNYVEGTLHEIPDPLHEAARRGNLPFLKECLSHKVSSTALDSMGNTPLYWAAHSGHVDCLKYLLNEPNPPVNAQNHFGDTPLHAASAKGRYNIVEILLKAGAQPTLENNNKESPEKLAMNLNIKNLLQKSTLGHSCHVGVSPEEYEDESD